MYKKSIFWFRQDLRVYDNTGLLKAVKESEQILPIFILDSNILENFGGLADTKFGFIRESLENLENQIQKLGGKKLLVLHGNPVEIIPKLCEKYHIDAVFCNKSYGTYGKKRDSDIKQILGQHNTDFFQARDFLLVEPEQIEVRKVFTPFFKLWQKQVKDTQEYRIDTIKSMQVEENTKAKDFICIAKHPYFDLDFGIQRLKKHIHEQYDTQRNALDTDGTSRLSVYLRFGIFSVRQIYNIAKQYQTAFVSELAWREFWHHIFYHFPITKEYEFQEKRRHIQWNQDKHLFQKWCDGETGYPIVDAAIKQLNQTNWMHGRARMIVASFLTKDLHIDWRLGEKYFAQKLLDYDEAVNIGNWQWSASVGADPKPLRIFNPILQSQKFDPQAKYIKKHLPQLSNQDMLAIHNPLEYTLNYIPPIVDHRIETQVARNLYKS